jgi:hypothetical protein
VYVEGDQRWGVRERVEMLGGCREEVGAGRG